VQLEEGFTPPFAIEVNSIVSLLPLKILFRKLALRGSAPRIVANYP
jgi:hypothetical protein